MTKRMIIVLLGLAVVFGGVFGWKAFVNYEIAKVMAARKQPTVTVAATPARAETWQPTYQAVGSLQAVQGVDVTTEVPGLVTKLNFQSGQEVKTGQLLVQLNDAPDRAKLQGLQAQADLARVQYERDKELIGARGVSKSQLDQDRAALDNAVAAVANQQAIVDQKTIRAPFDGQLGIRQVNLGQFIGAGTAVVTLQALNPIYVNFSLPQEDLKDLQTGMPVNLTVDTYPGKKFEGKVTTINPKVDEATRNVQIQATLDNEDKLLRPGMFARVAVVLPEQRDVVTVPSTAISYNPYGDTVFVIEETSSAGGEKQLTAKSVVVQTGERRGDQVEIVKGVTAGERVVVAGQLKLKNGTPVEINNAVMPSDNPAPTPPNT